MCYPPICPEKISTANALYPITITFSALFHYIKSVRLHFFTVFDFCILYSTEKYSCLNKGIITFSQNYRSVFWSNTPKTIPRNCALQLPARSQIAQTKFTVSDHELQWSIIVIWPWTPMVDHVLLNDILLTWLTMVLDHGHTFSDLGPGPWTAMVHAWPWYPMVKHDSSWSVMVIHGPPWSATMSQHGLHLAVLTAKRIISTVK